MNKFNGVIHTSLKSVEQIILSDNEFHNVQRIYIATIREIAICKIFIALFIIA